MSKRVEIIIMLIFLVVISIATTSMIEFYYAKDSNRMPILSVKSEDKAKQYYKYNSIFYNVYKCYSNNVYVNAKNAVKPYCPRIIKFDDKGFYTTINNLKISKYAYQMIYDISNTYNEIESFTTEKEVSNSVIVAKEYEKSLYSVVKEIIFEGKIIKIVAFKEYKINNKYGDYAWTYQTDDKEYYKCMKNDTFSEYKDSACVGEWKKLEMTNEWCNLASESTIVGIKNIYNKYCD